MVNLCFLANVPKVVKLVLFLLKKSFPLIFRNKLCKEKVFSNYFKEILRFEILGRYNLVSEQIENSDSWSSSIRIAL